MTLFLVSTSGQIWSIFGKSQSRQEYRTTAASSWSNSFSEVVLNRRFWLARQIPPPSQNQIQNRPKLWKSSMNSLNVGRFFSAFCAAICSGPMIITPVDDLGSDFSQVTITTVKFTSLLWRIFKLMSNQNSVSELDLNQSEQSTLTIWKPFLNDHYRRFHVTHC